MMSKNPTVVDANLMQAPISAKNPLATTIHKATMIFSY
ncbi:hypothetical protein ACVW1J_003600 [Serratia marcescens]